MKFQLTACSALSSLAGLCRRRTYLLLTLLLLALGAAAQAQQGAPLAKVLPGDTAIVVTGDAGWWWQNFATVRSLPEAKTGLASAEMLLGFSLEKDLLPAIGQVGCGFIDIKDNMPRALFMVQIRDQAAFAKVLPKLQARIETLSALKWMPTTHAGVSLRYADPGDGAPSIAWGQYGGWLVIGMGGGTIRQSIDAWKGATPALAANAGWAKSVAQLPQQPGVFFGLNGKAYAKFVTSMLSSMPGGGDTPFPTALYDGLIAAVTLSETEHGLRLESIGVMGPAILAQYKTLKQGLIPVDGKALAQLPAGTFVAQLLTNPGKWAAMQQAMLKTVVDANGWKKFRELLEITPETEKLLTPLLALLDNLTGQCAVAGTWTNEGGFGLVAIGETPSAEKATATAAQLSDLVKQALPQFPVEHKDGISSLPEIPIRKALQVKFCWTAQDAWFKCASNPCWLTGAAQTTLQFPPEAAGADSVFLADFAFLTPLLATLEKDAGNKAWIDAVRPMNLDKVQIVSYGTIAEDGASNHSVMDIKHVTGKSIVDAIASLVAMRGKTDTTTVHPQQQESMNNLRQLAVAANTYAHDHGEILPAVKTAEDIHALLTVDAKCRLQPSSQQPYLPNVQVAGKALAKFVGKEATTILFYDPMPYADGSRCVVYLDGHAEALSADAWDEVKAGL